MRVMLDQTIEFFHEDRKVSWFKEVTAEDLGDGIYRTQDANNLISVGQIGFVEKNGTLSAQKIGAWKSQLPNGDMIIKEYDSTSNATFREPIYNVKTNEAKSDAVWIDQQLRTRSKFDAQGVLIETRDFTKFAIRQEEFTENKSVFGQWCQKIKNVFGLNI